MKKDLFQLEKNILNDSATISENPELSMEEMKQEYEALRQHYSELIDQSKLITRVSDKLQKKLDKVNGDLEARNNELQQTIDALTKAKASKKAATIVLIIAVVFFLVSESLDPYIDRYAGGIVIALSVKGVLCLLLKPVESFIENLLLKRDKTIKVVRAMA
jgi:DNA repair exonuclease SbcCD ATPase subunit